MNRLLQLLGGLLALLALLLFITALIYPPEYAARVIRWGPADVYDYQKFPERPLQPAATPFTFTPAPDEEMVRQLFANQSGSDDWDAFLAAQRTQAFIVIQADQILYERYFNGADADAIVTSFSIAKSFTSALVGIAIADGHIGSVDDPITDYLPELTARDSRFAAITIRHLLLMASGIRYVETNFLHGDDAKTYYWPDLRQLALAETHIVGQPNERFLYNNYHPLLLGLILERATGMPVADYLQEKIWQPLGMAYPGSWSLDEAGFEKMESGINGRAIDFAKFGRLYLRQGNWEGEQIVPVDWVWESTAPTGAVNRSNYYPDLPFFADGYGYYKYMWWGLERDDGYDFAALGNHGQFLYISPAKELIIVRHGERYGRFGGPFDWVDLFYNVAADFPDTAVP